MINKTFSILMPGSLPAARLTVYIQEHYQEIGIDNRPLVLICPGGAYAYTSPREGEVLAMQFLAFGCHAAVLNYSCAPARYPVALLEAAYAMNLIRQHAEEWHVDPKGVIILGCSAGGHLAASLGTLWQEDFLSQAMGLAGEDRRLLRPDGMILCYPVITAGKFAHRGSFENLLGPEEGAEARLEDAGSLLSGLSLETRVTGETPPAFIWHTFTDDAVPVENSFAFVSALRRAGVSTEFHMYPVGGHGLSLAGPLTAHRDGGAVQAECTSWISLAHTWIESRYIKEL